MPVIKLRFLAPLGKQPDRPLFIFLPGMDGTGQLLATQLKGLGPAFDIRCLAIPSNDQNTWQILAMETIALLRAEPGLAQRPLYLCGESFGACLAMHVASRIPDQVACLVLVNSASAFQQSFRMPWVSSVLPWVSAPVYQLGTYGLLPFLSKFSRVSKTNRQALLDAMQSVSQPSVAWRLSLLHKFQLHTLPLHRVLCPTLIIAGGHDRLLPSVAEAQRLQQVLPCAQTHVLPESGHACLLESDVNLHTILATRRLLPRDLARSLPYQSAS